MTKIKTKIILTTILIILILIGYLNFTMIKEIDSLKHILINNKHVNKDQQKSLDIALIYSNPTSNSNLLTTGAKKSAQEENINLKLFSVKPSDQLNLSDYFKLSMLANYDGIIIDGQNPALKPLINKAAKQNIPVVTIISDLPSSARISYIGINNHRAGFIIGKKMIEKIPDHNYPKLAIISSQYSQKNLTPTSEYLKIFGFKEAISANPEAKIITWIKVKPDMLDALNTIAETINKHPEINGIFTTEPDITLAAANFLANNKSNRIVLIGYGNSKKIKQYIKDGIIKASVINNPEKIGYNAVKELKTYLQEKKVNLYSNITVKLLTPDKL